MFIQYADFVVEGSVQVEGINLPPRTADANRLDSTLAGLQAAYRGPFASLLVKELNRKADDQLLVIVVAEKSSDGLNEVSGWLILKYVGDTKLQACGFINNSEEALWQLNKRMEMYTGSPITPVIDTSESLDTPPALDFRG